MIRHHGSLAFAKGRRLPGMLTLLHDIKDDQPVAVVRTYLDPDARKVVQRILGPAFRAAAMFDPGEHVALNVAIGIEAGIRALALGHRPLWAVASTEALINLPTLGALGGHAPRHAHHRGVEGGRCVMTDERIAPFNRNRSEAKPSSWRDRFTLTKLADIVPDDEPLWLIDGLIPAGPSLGVIFGQPKSGKSFLTADMFLHVAMGRAYAGCTVQQGAVVYITKEGVRGFQRRMMTARQHHKRRTTGAVLRRT